MMVMVDSVSMHVAPRAKRAAEARAVCVRVTFQL